MASRRTRLPNGPIKKQGTQTTQIQPAAIESLNVGGSGTSKHSAADDGERRPAKKIKVLGDAERAEKAFNSKLQHARRLEDSEYKHTPICPQGIIFKWADQEKNDTTKAIINEKEETKFILTLTDENGVNWEFPYPRRHKFNWSSKRKLAKLNTWRGQIINRRLNRPGDTNVKSPRPHWTLKEKDCLMSLIRKTIQRNKRALNSSDWKSVAQRFNRIFSGMTMKVGEKMAPGLASQKPKAKNTGEEMEGIATGEKAATSKKVKVRGVAHVLGERKLTSIQAQVRRWPDAQQLIIYEVNAVTASANDNAVTTGEGSGSGEAFENEHDWDFSDDSDAEESDIEEESDDEEDGQRPVGQPAGANLVSTAA